MGEYRTYRVGEGMTVTTTDPIEVVAKKYGDRGFVEDITDKDIDIHYKGYILRWKVLDELWQVIKNKEVVATAKTKEKALRTINRLAKFQKGG